MFFNRNLKKSLPQKGICVAAFVLLDSVLLAFASDMHCHCRCSAVLVHLGASVAFLRCVSAVQLPLPNLFAAIPVKVLSMCIRKRNLNKLLCEKNHANKHGCTCRRSIHF